MTEKSVTFNHLSSTMQGLTVFLGIVAVVVPPVLGFVNFDKRIDIVEGNMHERHRMDDGKWSKVWEDVESNEDAIHALELVDKGLTIQYSEILRRIDETNQKIDNLIRVD